MTSDKKLNYNCFRVLIHFAANRIIFENLRLRLHCYTVSILTYTYFISMHFLVHIYIHLKYTDFIFMQLLVHIYIHLTYTCFIFMHF